MDDHYSDVPCEVNNGLPSDAKIFVARDVCGCTVAAWVGDNTMPDVHEELGIFLMERSVGQVVSIEPPTVRVGVTVPGGCPHK